MAQKKKKKKEADANPNDFSVEVELRNGVNLTVELNDDVREFRKDLQKQFITNRGIDDHQLVHIGHPEVARILKNKGLNPRKLSGRKAKRIASNVVSGVRSHNLQARQGASQDAVSISFLKPAFIIDKQNGTAKFHPDIAALFDDETVQEAFDKHFDNEEEDPRFAPADVFFDDGVPAEYCVILAQLLFDEFPQIQDAMMNGLRNGQIDEEIEEEQDNNPVDDSGFSAKRLDNVLDE